MTARSLTLASGLAVLLASPAFAQTTTPTTPANPAPSSPGTMLPGNAPPAPGATTPTDATGSATGMFYSMPAGAMQWRASDIMGKAVYNRANERIGEVNELIVDKDGRIAAAIIGVGGFLGIGERNVAVNFSTMQMMTENNTTRVMLDIDKTRLQQAPEFQRPSTWGRS
jgi:sporulation protein YlmC with PRC-barrel domain